LGIGIVNVGLSFAILAKVNAFDKKAYKIRSRQGSKYYCEENVLELILERLKLVY
jgi:hypothetical protein